MDRKQPTFFFPGVNKWGENTELTLHLEAVRRQTYPQAQALDPGAFTQILLVTGGRGCMECKQERFALEEHSLVLLNPQVRSTVFPEKGHKLQWLAIQIRGLRFARPELEEEPEVYASRGGPLPYAQALLEEFLGQTPEAGRMCGYLSAIVLTLILRQIPGLAAQVWKPVPAFCPVVKDYLDTHYQQPLRLDQLAQVIHQSKFHLAHCFTEAYGVSPMRYLVQRRIQAARDMLENTDFSSAQIGVMVGFSSPSHFGQAFLQATGSTPNAYREARKKGIPDAYV